MSGSDIDEIRMLYLKRSETEGEEERKEEEGRELFLVSIPNFFFKNAGDKMNKWLKSIFQKNESKPVTTWTANEYQLYSLH